MGYTRCITLRVSLDYADQVSRDSFVISAALSVKMSVLLYLPGILVVLFKRTGLLGTLRHMLVLLATQAAFGLPFLRRYPWSYLNHSYEFTRAFLYKWTVNWRFVSEETFLSSAWARGLMVGHLATLVFFGLWRWCRRDGGTFPVLYRGLRSPSKPSSLLPLTADCGPSVFFFWCVLRD